ncbi:hypothetical protein [Enterobacter asburiae]|uniref:hypothetical protein n=1 Tax=Enterobacter asburiae TaxID=61645 RepID=UPI003BBA0F54
MKDTFKYLLIIIVGVMVYLWVLDDGNSPAGGSSAKEPDASSSCNENDDECVFKDHVTAAFRDCRGPIERSSKYDFEWTDSMLNSAFSRYVNNPKDHQITYWGDKLKFTNGFNAKVNMMYSCTIDTQTDQMVDYTVEEGRLP